MGNPFDDATPKVDSSGSNPFDAATPKSDNRSFLDRLKGVWDQAQAATTQRRQAFLAHPGQFILSELGNAPAAISPGAVVRYAREGLGQSQPWSFEKYLPDPTVAGMAKGLTDVVTAPTQLAAHIAGPAPVAGAIDRGVTGIQNYYDQNFVPSKSGEVLGQAVPFVATLGGSAAAETPAATTVLGKGLQIAKGAAKAGVVGAAAAPTLTPEANVTSADDYANRKKAEAVTGGVIGTGIGLAAPAVAYLGGKTVDALAGTKFGRILGIAETENPKFAGATALKAQMDQAGIPTTLGDLTGDPATRRMEDAMARNDPRMMEFRIKQNQAAYQASQKVLADLRAQMDSAGWTGIDDLQRAAAGGGKRAAAAKTLLTAIQNSGDDWAQIAKTGGNLKLFLGKLESDAAFDKATTLADQFGSVPVPNLRKTVDDAASALNSNVAGDEGAKSFVSRIQSGISNRDESGLFKATDQDMSFSGLRRLRSSLNARIADINTGKVSASSEELPQLQAMVTALDKDLGNFAGSNGDELRQAYDAASSIYKSKVVPYKEAAFGKALAADDPQRLIQLFNSKNPYEQQRFFNLLGDKGQSAVRFGLVDDALSAGEKTQRGVNGLGFSAAQAASKLEALANRGTSDVVFPGGPDRFAVKGLAKILRTIDRSDVVAFNPPTGQLSEGVGAAVRGDTTVLGAGEKIWSMINRDRLFQLYTDPRARGLLIRASDLQPGSPALKKIVNVELPKLIADQPNVVRFAPINPAAAAEVQPQQQTQP